MRQSRAALPVKVISLTRDGNHSYARNIGQADVRQAVRGIVVDSLQFVGTYPGAFLGQLRIVFRLTREKIEVTKYDAASGIGGQ